jgi:hypothetical protein
MAIAWDPSLPVMPMDGTLGISYIDPNIRDDAEIGPGFKRPRWTGLVIVETGSLPLTLAQYARLFAFWRHDLKLGNLKVTRASWLDGVSREYEFFSLPAPQRRANTLFVPLTFYGLI